MYPVLPVSLDCPFLIAPSVFSNVSHGRTNEICIPNLLQRNKCRDIFPVELIDNWLKIKIKKLLNFLYFHCICNTFGTPVTPSKSNISIGVGTPVTPSKSNIGIGVGTPVTPSKSNIGIGVGTPVTPSKSNIGIGVGTPVTPSKSNIGIGVGTPVTPSKSNIGIGDC